MCHVYMSFNSLQTKTDLELAEEREIYLKNGVLTSDKVRQEMGLEPISTPPKTTIPSLMIQELLFFLQN